MRVISVIISLAPVLSFFLLKKDKDISSPYNIFNFLYLINILIPIVLLAKIDNINNISNINIRKALYNDNMFLRYSILQTLSYYLVVIALRTKLIFRKQDSKKIEKLHYVSKDYTIYNYVGIVIFTIGFLSFYMIIQQIGGIRFFLSNLQYRTHMVKNFGVYNWIIQLLNFGLYFIAYAYIAKYKKMSSLIICLSILVGLITGLGGRKAIIMNVIIVLMIYTAFNSNFKVYELLKIKYLVYLLVLYFLFIVIVNLRTDGAFEKFINNPIAFFSSSNKGLFVTIIKESYVSFYVALVDYFDNNQYWMGKTFIGLLTAFIPSKIYHNKFPVDDGMYLYSILQGRSDINPPMPTKLLNTSSYPLETFGSMYSNFGIIGLTFGMILLGIIYKKSYKKYKKSNNNLFYIVLYSKIIFTFEISTLRIVQLIIFIIMFKILCSFTEILNRKDCKL